MRRKEFVEAATRAPPASTATGTPSPRSSSRRRGSSGVNRLLRGMPPEGSAGTGSSTDSPRRGAVSNGNGRGGKGKASTGGGGSSSSSSLNSQLPPGRAGGGGRGGGNGNGNGGVSLSGNSNDRRISGGRSSGAGSRLEGSGSGRVAAAEGGFPEEGRDDNTGNDDAGTARIEQLRALTKSCLEENMPDTAAYYADKLVTFSGFDREALLLLAKAHFGCGAYLRTVHLLAQHRLLDFADNFGLRACHLAARSLRAADKTEESISLLERVLGQTDAHAAEVKERAKTAQTASTRGASRDDSPCADHRKSWSGPASASNGGVSDTGIAAWPTPGVDVFAALCCLRGQAYANLDNRPRAALWLRTALEIDARCVEALHCLTRLHLLSIDQQASMVSRLDYGEPKEKSWVHLVFKSHLNRPAGSKAQIFEDLDRVGLGGNLDVLSAKAECCYEQNDAQQALDICRQVFRSDPHNSACLPVYLAAMVELKMKSQLFYTAHQLVEAGPRKAVSWFAVGCYYHLLSKNDLAQRYFLKATKLDGRFAPAWIGFGNAFAAQEETDQAVSAYRSAARLFQGSHLPLLYIGMEYVRTHNLALARNFLMGALSLSPSDPLVLNELGVVHFSSKEYEQAKERFEKVLEIVECLSSQALEAWESTVFNLGHCHRKLGRLDEAAAHYLRARELAPERHSVHSALAYTYHLQGRHDDAISGYHRALGLKSDDPFASEMLKKALQESFFAEPCLGLTSLLSKASLDADDRRQPGASAAPKTPALGGMEPGADADTDATGRGGERSFSFGEATTPSSASHSSGDRGQWRDWRRGSGFTPAAVYRRRGARARAGGTAETEDVSSARI